MILEEVGVFQGQREEARKDVEQLQRLLADEVLVLFEDDGRGAQRAFLVGKRRDHDAEPPVVIPCRRPPRARRPGWPLLMIQPKVPDMIWASSSFSMSADEALRDGDLVAELEAVLVDEKDGAGLGLDEFLELGDARLKDFRDVVRQDHVRAEIGETLELVLDRDEGAVLLVEVLKPLLHRPVVGGADRWFPQLLHDFPACRAITSPGFPCFPCRASRSCP